MSRQSGHPERPLSLTEELEKLEQSITLTLQEIDQNFSQAHRIVTTSILPIVEQYTEHSRDVWDGAKFWKQFFEASANVSLSGYEERPSGNDDTVQEPTATEDELSADITQSTTREADQSYATPASQRHNVPDGHGDDLDITALTISSHSTPRAPAQQPEDDMTMSSIEHSSSYENLKKHINEEKAPFDLPDSSTLPSTPGRQPFFPPEASSVTPMSSPFIPPASSAKYQSASRDNRYHKPSDPVMHQMLDKTYRVQATPLGKGYYNAGGGTNTHSKFAVTPKQAASSSKYAFDDSPISSPEPEAPQLHSEIFSSPIKGVDATPGTNRKRRTSSNRVHGTPKPGFSVLTPAKKPGTSRALWDSDDDLDEDLGPSPPKTMQFHIPQSRLMQTPAKEASKRIVDDLLATAGAGDVTDDLDDQSPSVIRRMERLEDDTF
ncbi:hypothetical protein N7456_008060 [Penicillium angulare]|uniref:DASH complex subunit ASK1 n=1 Tax=Penicillium angulare TaxID=116970 RepID=A0A9W9FC37_9EURO|nr:hypothetical protein N7456_008060 [Penicillium angulare]